MVGKTFTVHQHVRIQPQAHRWANFNKWILEATFTCKSYKRLKTCRHFQMKKKLKRRKKSKLRYVLQREQCADKFDFFVFFADATQSIGWKPTTGCRRHRSTAGNLCRAQCVDSQSEHVEPMRKKFDFTAVE